MGNEEGSKASYQLSLLKSYLTIHHLQLLIRLHVSQGLMLDRDLDLGYCREAAKACPQTITTCCSHTWTPSTLHIQSKYKALGTKLKDMSIHLVFFTLLRKI